MPGTYTCIPCCMLMFWTLYAVVCHMYHDVHMFVMSSNIITEINCEREFFNMSCSNTTSKVFSLGYKSNGGSSSSVKAFTVFSGGAFSLSKSKSVQITSSQENVTVIANNGDSSAHSVNELIVAQAQTSTIDCNGFSSCSHIGKLEFSSILNCAGDQSCAYSSIFSQPNGVSSIIVASGAYSLINSTIYANATETILTIDGHYAAFNAKLYCLESARCAIYCYDNGCVNFRFKCDKCDDIIVHYDIDEGVPDPCTCNLNSNSNTNVSLCPVDIDLAIPDSYSKNIPSNPFYSITTALDWRLNNYGYGFAQTMDEICSEKSKSGTGDDGDGDKCNGSDVDDYVYDDAYEMNNDGPITNNASICCRGYKSCKNASDISSSKNVICSGGESCLNAYSFYGSTVYCSGYSSCAASSFGIYFEDAVYCLGALSCVGTEIFNGAVVYCGGEFACTNITILNVKQVIMAASRDSHFGRITSSSGSNTRLTLIGYAPLPQAAVTFEFICGTHSSGDVGEVCLIECGTQSSCSHNLKVDCTIGTCYIVCNYTTYGIDIHCPTLEYGNYIHIDPSWIDDYDKYDWPWEEWFTNSSTKSPSKLASKLPSTIPTYQPSSNPTKSHVTTTLPPAPLVTTSYTMTSAQFEFSIIGVFDLSGFVSNASRRLTDNEQTRTSPHVRMCILSFGGIYVFCHCVYYNNKHIFLGDNKHGS